MLTFSQKSLAVISLTAVVFLVACSKSDNTAPGVDPYVKPVVPVTGNSNLAITANATFGSILSDESGKPLYFFAIDADGKSGCSGTCATIWPVYYAGNETAPTGVTATDIKTITRADGSKQTTYKGWPLYYYAGDTGKTVTGDASGGTWFVAKPDYSIMLANNQLLGSDGKTYIDGAVAGTGITQYLTDAAGRTLYDFAPDKLNLNTYTKADLSNNTTWPIYESDIMNVPSIIQKDLMFQITSVGKKQLTYKGHPLYYFGPDVNRGDTKGVSVPTPGTWRVLNLNTVALTN